ncbi:TetR/AcrR family transcriptional regulator [Pedobacter sp.]|jgi:AcrR family transcriptional regulator|uniref:TetR/AcrR family transcriptional regulator n=1 Tax=Pedobacter sp. TaxID=1411316 RepID=UPI002CF4E515|nr:TetR/AcrR family transcriptional regulator [Pedobacter sp.]HWW38815.1 TetR/AcrR family transcriptional regulator [Pedobacter sp.]
MLETDKKRELIIEGAIKRFTHFGINKTTMNEIADDLSVSKPSLYYYFPDKSSLILGVINKIFDDYFEAIHKEKPAINSLEATLANFIEVKHRFFQKYYMLHLSSGSNDASFNSDELKNHVTKMKERDVEIHAHIFQAAVVQGDIEVSDLNKITELYLESLAGITSLCVMHGYKELIPSKKDFKVILEKQLSLSRIFIKGLRK